MKSAAPDHNPNSPNATNVPHTWPGAFDAFKYSQSVVKYNLGTLLWLFVLNCIISLVLPPFDKYFSFPLPTILSYVISAVLSVASVFVYLAGSNGRKLSLENSLRSCKPEVLIRLFLSSIVVSLLCAGALLLLIVPFFFVFPRVMLTPYFLIHQNLGPLAAIRASWETSKGHAGKVWGVVLASIVMVLPAITIIGIPVAIYLLFMYGAAPVILYRYIAANPAPAQSPDSSAPQPPA